MNIREWFGRVFGGEPEPPEPEQQRPRAPTAEDIEGALVRVEELVTGGAVPTVVTSRVRRVAKTVRETIPRLPNLGPGSPQAYSVVATATDYLPEALSGYLRLPREWANSRPVENGKTSLMLLIDQLDLLGATMDKIFDAVVRVDADALIAHGRFLQEKFGTPGAAPRPSRPEPPPESRSSLDLESP
ncbi:hypothetical protein [Microlunatus speluncae]|uniref:hypothetical protein n=1 Tax=Microlunatus speluncae TaxID=2594267 RepID=UPI0012667FF0|nr:hypothetical protein [Microlunatus speluncae]